MVVELKAVKYFAVKA